LFTKEPIDYCKIRQGSSVGKEACGEPVGTPVMTWYFTNYLGTIKKHQSKDIQGEKIDFLHATNSSIHKYLTGSAICRV
jgi:hypothetical protein